jgi:tRNA dimethylallyltransferase
VPVFVTESVLAIFGPTGSGKSAVAEALAERIPAEIVSSDSMQVYQGLPILTNQSPARLVGIWPLEHAASVGEYQQLAHAAIDEILAAGRTPVVVGGTGLYLRAALADLDLKPPAPPDVRARLEADVAARGAQALHAELVRRAPWAAQGIAPTDRQRIVRALELDAIGALEPPPSESQLWTTETRHPTRMIGLVMEREALYERIDARVDAMVAAGAIDEVRAAHAAGASPSARQALGFDELLAGDIDAMKRRTRNYAKRQLTWMRKLPSAELVDVTGREPDDVARELVG